MKRKAKNKFDEKKLEIVLLIFLMIIFVVSLLIGHHFNKESYHDNPNVKKIEVEQKENAE